MVSYRLDELTLPRLTLPALGSALHRHKMVALSNINERVPFLLYTASAEGMQGCHWTASFPFPVIVFSEGRRPWISRFDSVHLPVTLEICGSNGLTTATGASCTAAGTVSLPPEEALKPST